MVGSLGGGLARLQKDQLTVFNTKDGLSSDLIHSLLLDSDGTLWIGTDGGGLNRWAQGRMAGFTTRQGLLDNVITQILEDDDGCLWLGCSHGICRVSKRVLNDVAAGAATSVHPLNFGISEGMASEGCVSYFGAALKTRAGQLCFATAKGIVVIDPRRQAHDEALPTALLDKMLVDNKVLQNPVLASPRPASSNHTEPALTIPAGRHSFDFCFTGINFDAPEKIQFRYQVNGLDPGWTNGVTCAWRITVIFRRERIVFRFRRATRMANGTSKEQACHLPCGRFSGRQPGLNCCPA